MRTSNKKRNKLNFSNDVCHECKFSIHPGLIHRPESSPQLASVLSKMDVVKTTLGSSAKGNARRIESQIRRQMSLGTYL